MEIPLRSLEDIQGYKSFVILTFFGMMASPLEEHSMHEPKISKNKTIHLFDPPLATNHRFLSDSFSCQYVSFRIFDELYLRYDEWYKRNRVIFECELKALKMLKPSGRGLDLGVGTGVFAREIGTEFGIDPALNPLKLAKNRGVEAIQAMGEHLPFRDRCFDYVLITLSLCFFEDPISILREARREMYKRFRENHNLRYPEKLQLGKTL